KFPLPFPGFAPECHDAAHAVGTGCRMIDSCVAQRYCRRTLGQIAEEILTRVGANRLRLSRCNMLLMQPLYPCLKFLLASRGPTSKPIHRGGSPGRERLRSNDCNSRKYARRTTV